MSEHFVGSVELDSRTNNGYIGGERVHGQESPRPIRLSVVLVLVTMASGLLTRFGPLGLPRLAVKYGGSTLWALMIYWIVSTLLPRWPVRTIAILAGSLATSVEFLKLYHSPRLDSFRLTVPGILMFGRFFSRWDILAYWFAMVIGAVFDKCIRRRHATWKSRQPMQLET